MATIVIPKSTAALWFTLGAPALALAICLPSCAAMLSLAADDQEQGRAMGNNQSMQVGAKISPGWLAERSPPPSSPSPCSSSREWRSQEA
jgi:hypothetical protein